MYRRSLCKFDDVEKQKNSHLIISKDDKIIVVVSSELLPTTAAKPNQGLICR